MTGWIENGSPIIEMNIQGKIWKAAVDTGFNSDLELPRSLFDAVVIRYVSEGYSMLAGGLSTVQAFYQVRVPFDGQVVEALATFVDEETILLGTGLLKEYVLLIDFPAGSVHLTHTSNKPRQFADN